MLNFIYVMIILLLVARLTNALSSGKYGIPHDIFHCAPAIAAET